MSPTEATPEYGQERRRSNAAVRHRNRAAEAKHPGKGNRHNRKTEG